MELIKRAAKIVYRKDGVCGVVLHGSQAEGTATKRSDRDLLLIVDTVDIQGIKNQRIAAHNVGARASSRLNQKGFSTGKGPGEIDILAIRSEEWLTPGSAKSKELADLIRSAKTKGRILSRYL